ncbi:trafficking protein particle complex subunit 8 [Diachasma alloeum]|uniref:trafficking protein particle complex subunit 8 n=1 Tax=Diachasma alloeum TaxID=454923 RepID=UPI00073836F7|nr:trafficking protein particle complex subunit 8 [Diachasma alloeum]
MAQCKLTPREFICNAFSPQIGAVCSATAEAICQKNNLSFIELLQPFCNLNTEGYIKDPQGTIVPVRNLHLSIQDIYSQPPEPTVARKLLNDSVTTEQCERTTTITVSNIKLDIPVSVPWYESWRDMFLSVQFPSDHEFTKHYLACLLVVSTSDESPLEKLQQMASQLHQSAPGKLPKWFNNNALRYYILLHDAAQDHEKQKAESVFAEMKNLYDSNNCFLLQMNSRPPGQSDETLHLPDPWSQFLTKQPDYSLDHSSSPRTPADTTGVSSMPNQVTSGHDKTSQAGTPVAPQNPILLSPDVTDKISLSSEISDIPSLQVELGQEAVPVTIHPLSPETEKPKLPDTLEALKSSGSPININVWADSPSRPPAHHGARLSTQDLDRIRSLISEFCLKSLLPYVEKQINLLNDVISNKKGVSRSLFSATKRWFGTNKPGAAGSTPTNAVIYTTESPELQLRRLGDLCFMFGHYTLAYQAYHSAKRDFAADQAWLYYAGALEMAALSAFMQGEMTRKTIEYMDDAILTYSNSCKMPQFATRATLLSSECLKGKNLYGEAAKQLIRMTSEDSDLRSALLLEQAAYCFILSKMVHKYAFHAVLAGHRYSKAGQRKHSLRCYQQSYQVYDGRGWSLAEDHIHFTIGRQAASLKQVEEAARAFGRLLNPSSRQPAPQQAAFLREFLHIHNLLLQESSHYPGLPVLPLPLINGNEIKVLLGPFLESPRLTAASGVSFDHSDEDDDPRWAKLEEHLVSEGLGAVPMIFKPTIALYTHKTNNTSPPTAVIDEPIHLSIELQNPLHINIPLSKVKLIWTFEKDGEVFSNETITENSLSESTSVETSVIDHIVLQPMRKQRISLSCTPTQTGSLKIQGLSYDLSNPSNGVDQPVVNPSVVIHGKRLFEIKGPKLKNVKEKPGAVMYGIDKRLDINVVDKSPFLGIYFSKVSPEMLCGEMQRIDVTFRNIGNAGLTNILVGSMSPELFCFENPRDEDSSRITDVNEKPVTKIVLPSSSGGVIGINQEFTVPLWIRAPHKKGNHRLDLLFYYENEDVKGVPRYRLCRHTWQLTVLDSIHIKAIVRQSAVTSDEALTSNLVIQVKNANQVHDPFMQDIELTKISLRSDAWWLSESLVKTFPHQIKPQETCHLVLKLCRRDHDDYFSSVSLGDAGEPGMEGLYEGFVRRQQMKGCTDSNQNHVKGTEGNLEVFDGGRAGATMIVRWRARIMEGKTVARVAIGHHHVDMRYLNKLYKHPEEVVQPEQREYSSRLKIFGPDRNVPDSNSEGKAEGDQETTLANALSFSLSHEKNLAHDFGKERVFVVPVLLHVQNNSRSRVDVRVNTLGTSSQAHLPSVKSQLYSPQASTFFRYACHTSIKCHIEAYGRQTMKLHAVISSAGTYDLASRLTLSAKTSNFEEFVTQKWRTESVCIVNDERL